MVLFGHGVGGLADDGQVRREGAHLPGGFVAVHARHLDVHEHDVEGPAAQGLQEVARLENWTLVPVPCQWDACLAAVEAGTLDLMPDVARTDSRVRLYDFHRVPALHSWSQLYRRPDQPIESMLDLQGKRVAVLEGSSQQAYLRTLLDGFGLRTELLPHASFEAAFAQVAAGQADAVASNHHFGDIAARRHKLLETSLMFQPSRLFFVSGKGRNAELLAALDRAGYIAQRVRSETGIGATKAAKH